MKKIKLIIILLAIIPIQTYATSGRLKGGSIVSCNGVTYGQHGDGHWHKATKNGDRWYPDGASLGYTSPCSQQTSANSNTQTYNNSNNNSSNNNSNTNTNNSNKNTNQNTNDTKTQVTKNNDVSLKEVIIDDEKLDVNNLNKYTTNKSKIKIVATPTNDKTKIVLSNNYNKLTPGDNNIAITAIAEDKTIKVYLLNIYRKSNNTNAVIKYNNNKIKFTNNKSKKITVKKEKITFDVLLEDNKSKSNVKKNYNLKKGNNKIKITVTAENNEKRNYIINIYRKRGLF